MVLLFCLYRAYGRSKGTSKTNSGKCAVQWMLTNPNMNSSGPATQHLSALSMHGNNYKGFGSEEESGDLGVRSMAAF